jgi:RNA polymerase sigma-70 factor (ECF subfamily)
MDEQANLAPSHSLDELLQRARTAWPELGEPSQEFVRQLQERLANLSAAPTSSNLAELRAEDLFLASTCASGKPEALRVFDERVWRPLRGAVARIDPSSDFVDEVGQRLREKLFSTSAGLAPRIREYSGRGALAGWVRVAAVRLALDLKRSRTEGAGAADDVADDAVADGAQADPELRLLKERYGAAFQSALSKALDALSDEQCNLLRLQIVDGLQTHQIASLFGVDRSTVKRRLVAAREVLLEKTRELLHNELHISPSEFDSLAALVQSQLHVSLSRLLRR